MAVNTKLPSSAPSVEEERVDDEREGAARGARVRLEGRVVGRRRMVPHGVQVDDAGTRRG